MRGSEEGSAVLLLHPPLLQNGFAAGFMFSAGMSGLSQAILHLIFFLLSEVSYMIENK